MNVRKFQVPIEEWSERESDAEEDVDSEEGNESESDASSSEVDSVEEVCCEPIDWSDVDEEQVVPR